MILKIANNEPCQCQCHDHNNEFTFLSIHDEPCCVFAYVKYIRNGKIDEEEYLELVKYEKFIANLEEEKK